MKSVERLIRIACHYNKIIFNEFYREYKYARVIDCKAMVFNYLKESYKISLFEISELFDKDEDYIKKYIKHHKEEINVINHYTKLYENTKTQFENWSHTEIDLAYSIIKTKYDQDNEIKYEQILNENCQLKYQLEKLNRKKSYV